MKFDFETKVTKQQTFQFEVGDFVTLPKNAQNTAWEHGHIVNIEEITTERLGTVQALNIGHGSLTCPKNYWLYGMGLPYIGLYVGECYRRVKPYGAWVKVYQNDDFCQSVSWWAD